MSWTNADGLTVLMHGEQGEVKYNGSTFSSIANHLVVDLPDATTLTDATVTIYANDSFVPNDAVILRATFIVDTAFTTGASGTLDIGLYDASGSAIAAVGGDDAIDAAVAVSALGADDVVLCDGAGVGVRMTEDAYVGFTYDTGALTAGAGKLVIEYIQA